MVEVEGTSGGHLDQPHCSSRGPQSQQAQDHVQTDFEYLQGWRYNLPGQPVRVIGHTYRESVP